MGDIVDQIFDNVGDTIRGPERHVVPNCNNKGSGTVEDVIDLTDVVDRIDTTASYRISANNQDTMLGFIENAYHGIKCEEDNVIDLVGIDYNAPATEDEKGIHALNAVKHRSRARAKASKSRQKSKKKKKRTNKSRFKNDDDNGVVIDDDDDSVEARDDDNAFDGFIDNVLDTVEYVWGPLSRDKDMDDESYDGKERFNNRNIHPFSEPEFREKQQAKVARRKHVKNTLANKWETIGFLLNPEEKKQRQEEHIKEVKKQKEEKSKKKKRGKSRKKKVEKDRILETDAVQPQMIEKDRNLENDAAKSQTKNGNLKTVSEKTQKSTHASKDNKARNAKNEVKFSKTNSKSRLSKTKRDILQLLSGREEQQAMSSSSHLEIVQLTKMMEMLDSLSLIIEANKCTIPEEVVTQVQGDYRKLANTLADNKMLEMVQGDTCISGGANIQQTLSSDCPRMNIPDTQVLDRNPMNNLQNNYQNLCKTLIDNNVLEMIDDNACQVGQQDILGQTTKNHIPGIPEPFVPKNNRHRQIYEETRDQNIPERSVWNDYDAGQRNDYHSNPKVKSIPDRSDFDVHRSHGKRSQPDKWLVDAVGSDMSVSSTETEISAALKLAHLQGAPSRGDVLDKLYESCEARVLNAANRLREELLRTE